ncbi:hypothetical protein BJ742DRAFT_776874 [Cladochytrium replicatum]|nr:hypothetical protein BJ742DRAFT_776874 [Cladochytrium replicatum]
MVGIQTAAGMAKPKKARGGEANWIYMIKQDGSQTVSPTDLEVLDQPFVDLKAEKDRLSEEQAQYVLTNEQIQRDLATLAKDNAKCTERLESFQSDRKQISDEERKEVEMYFVKTRKEWKTRKAKDCTGRQFDDMWGAIMEGYPGNPKSLKEKLWIETDKAVGVDLSWHPLEGHHP